MRYRTRGGIVALRRGIALRLDGLDLHGTWRNGPAAALVGDQVALVTSDEQDEAHLYWRLDNQNLLDDLVIFRDLFLTGSMSMVTATVPVTISLKY